MIDMQRRQSCGCCISQAYAITMLAGRLRQRSVGCPAEGTAGAVFAGTPDGRHARMATQGVSMQSLCAHASSSCRLDGWEGAVSADPGEVAGWRWAPLAAVAAEVHQDPARFTAWFREELALLNWLGAGSCNASRVAH